jgi:hypothetical protein
MGDGRHRRGHELAHPPRALCILLAGPRLLCEEDGCDSSTPRGTGGGVHPLGWAQRQNEYRATRRVLSSLDPPSSRVAVFSFCRLFGGDDKGRNGSCAKAKGCATDLDCTSCSRYRRRSSLFGSNILLVFTPSRDLLLAGAYG